MVPAYFNNAQRHSMQDTGILVGLHVECVIKEPMAIAHKVDIDVDIDINVGGGDNEKNILVFDLCGGTFDVTLLAIDNGIFEVLATNGDTRLGGSDVDCNVMEQIPPWVQSPCFDGIEMTTTTMTASRGRSSPSRSSRSALAAPWLRDDCRRADRRRSCPGHDRLVLTGSQLRRLRCRCQEGEACPIAARAQLKQRRHHRLVLDGAPCMRHGRCRLHVHVLFQWHQQLCCVWSHLSDISKHRARRDEMSCIHGGTKRDSGVLGVD